MKQLRTQKWLMCPSTMLILVSCLALSLSSALVRAPAVQAAGTGTWTQLPLYGGNIGCLAIDPLTPTTLYAVIGSRVFRSVNSGTTWTAVNTGLTAQAVSCLAINPLTPTTLYAGTHVGVYRSVNRGATWTAANAGIEKWEAICLAIDPLTPTTLYVGTHNGVYRSADSGGHWTSANTGETKTRVAALAINPRTPTTLYAGTNNTGVFRSTDSGTTWTAVNTGLPHVDVWCLAIDPLTPTTLYVGTWIVGTQGGVFRSTDSGDHWTAVNTGITGMTVYSLAVDPLTPSTLYVGTNGYVCRSTDSGATWKAMSIGHDYISVYFLAIDSFTPSTLYAGTNVDIFRSTDSGATWTVVKLGITSRNVTSLAIDPKTPATLYASFTHNGVFRYVGVSPYALTTTVSPSAGGSIGRSPDASSYAPGTVVTLTASPVAGYVFTGWSGALSGTKNPATVTMDANKKVTASFTVKVKRVIQLKIGSRTMYVDENPVVLDAAPIILNSRTLLPIRALIETLGGEVLWSPSARTVDVFLGERSVDVGVGGNIGYVNDKAVAIDPANPKVVPIIMSGRTLLPLRFVAEALALDIQWNATTQAITITYTP